MIRLLNPRWVLLLCMFALALPGFAQDYKSNPRELVRRAIANEATQTQKQYFMVRSTKRNKNGQVLTRELIQTPELVLARLIGFDGHPISEDGRKKEDARLNRLLNDPEELAKKQKEQREDDQRIRRMVQAIPDAFDFQYSATEPTKSGDLIVLKFTPNPNWNPPSRELSVFTGMSGTMKIAVPRYRLAFMEAQLFKNVEFGWGILGHLNKGGEFMIEQGEAYAGHWALTRLKLRFTGKVLIFKSLNILNDEQMSDFRPVPPLGVAQALDRLKQVETEYARNANGGK